MRISFLLAGCLLVGCSRNPPSNEEGSQIVPEAERELCLDVPLDSTVRECLSKAVLVSRKEILRSLERHNQKAAKHDESWQENRQKRDPEPTHVELLAGSQAAWEKYVEAQCKLEGYTARGGTGESEFRLRCFERHNQLRLAELRSPSRRELLPLESKLKVE